MEAFRNNRDLGEFVLEGVHQAEGDVVLGTGSYGTVEEVTIANTKYAAKKIHAALLETQERGGVNRIVTRYIQECRLMSKLRHPNITQFIGICFLDNSRLPLLVMEKLDNNLDDLLESYPNIPITLKTTILEDIIRGLHYLHQQSPCVIHRDLTAKNVLLTVSFKAKITDFGNSRLVQLQPNELARTLTAVPGTQVYMSPEALSESRTVYGPPLDVFSFGVIVLYTLNQVFPGDLLSPTHLDSSNPNLLLARSEFERRVTYTDLLERSLAGGRQHPLFVLVRECLSNSPERRPLTSHLLSTLEEMRTEIDVGLLLLDIGRVKTVMSLVAKDKRITALQGEVVAKEQTITEKDTQLQEKDTQLQEKDTQLQEKDTQLQEKDTQLQEKDTRFVAHRNELVTKDIIIAQKNLQLSDRTTQLADKDTQLAAKNTQLADKDTQLADKDTQLADKDTQLADKDTQLADNEAQIQEHREEIGRKDAELARRAGLTPLLKVQDQPPPELKTPLTLKWKRGKDMPLPMFATVQSVVIGNKVFVGGGFSYTDQDMYTVMVYDLQGDQWSTLPLYSAHWFAMTSLNNKLVLVGGYVRGTVKPTNIVSVLESDKWVCPYPALNIARFYSMSVSFNNHIIVAGGVDSVDNRISSVEVLDITSNRWCIADPLPCVRYSMRSVVVGNMCYLMGGVDQTDKATKVVHSVDLVQLTENAVTMATDGTRSRHSPLWHTVEDAPLIRCSPFTLKGSLLAVGGCDNRKNGSTSIYLYQSGTRRWVNVGDLPTARYDCTCSVLPNGEVLVAGGYPTKKSVEFLTVTECS